MFDQYGTVVDMQGGLTKVAKPYLESKGWTGNPNSFVTWWRRTHFENSMIDALLHKEHTPYREIGVRAVDHVLNRSGIAHTDDEVHALVAEIAKSQCFPEVPAALQKLQTRFQLVVLSNGDPDMLETAKDYHKIPFDRIISVSEANSFKPHVDTYTRAASLVGLRMDQVLFVANHAFDVIGAKAAGMATAFINRRERPFERTPHQPDITVRPCRSSLTCSSDGDATRLSRRPVSTSSWLQTASRHPTGKCLESLRCGSNAGKHRVARHQCRTCSTVTGAWAQRAWRRLLCASIVFYHPWHWPLSIGGRKTGSHE